MSPDIAMCNDSACPSSRECYRFMARPSMRQSFGQFERRDGWDKCMDGFMRLWNKKESQ